MKAITLHQPWAWAIAHAGKDVENRTWAPPDWFVGERIAIHAGKKIDADAVIALQRGDCGLWGTWCPDRATLAKGCIVATTRLVGWCAPGRGVLKAEGVAHPEDLSPWFFGPVGWLLAETKALPVWIPCRGAQRLWNVPADIEARLTA